MSFFGTRFHSVNVAEPRRVRSIDSWVSDSQTEGWENRGSVDLRNTHFSRVRNGSQLTTTSSVKSLGMDGSEDWTTRAKIFDPDVHASPSKSQASSDYSDDILHDYSFFRERLTTLWESEMKLGTSSFHIRPFSLRFQKIPTEKEYMELISDKHRSLFRGLLALASFYVLFEIVFWSNWASGMIALVTLPIILSILGCTFHRKSYNRCFPTLVQCCYFSTFSLISAGIILSKQVYPSIMLLPVESAFMLTLRPGFIPSLFTTIFLTTGSSIAKLLYTNPSNVVVSSINLYISGLLYSLVSFFTERFERRSYVLGKLLNESRKKLETETKTLLGTLDQIYPKSISEKILHGNGLGRVFVESEMYLFLCLSLDISNIMEVGVEDKKLRIVKDFYSFSEKSTTIFMITDLLITFGLFFIISVTRLGGECLMGVISNDKIEDNSILSIIGNLTKLLRKGGKLIKTLGPLSKQIGIRGAIHAGPGKGGVLKSSRFPFEIFGEGVLGVRSMCTKAEHGQILVSQLVIDLFKLTKGLSKTEYANIYAISTVLYTASPGLQNNHAESQNGDDNVIREGQGMDKDNIKEIEKYLRKYPHETVRMTEQVEEENDYTSMIYMVCISWSILLFGVVEWIYSDDSFNLKSISDTEALWLRNSVFVPIMFACCIGYWGAVRSRYSSCYHPFLRRNIIRLLLSFYAVFLGLKCLLLIGSPGFQDIDSVKAKVHLNELFLWISFAGTSPSLNFDRIKFVIIPWYFLTVSTYTYCVIRAETVFNFSTLFDTVIMVPVVVAATLLQSYSEKKILTREVYFRVRHGQAIESIQVEKDLIEAVISSITLSSISQKLTNSSESIYFQTSSCVLCVSLSGLNSSFSPKNDNEFLEVIGEIYDFMDGIAQKFGFEPQKTAGATYIFVASGDEVDSKVIENASQICFLIQEGLGGFQSQYHNWLPDLHPRFAVDVGSLIAGFVGKSSTCLDLWGSPVSNTLRICALGQDDEILLSKKANEILGKKASIQATKCILGAGVVCYSLLKKSSPWTDIIDVIFGDAFQCEDDLIFELH